jgi:hypothetical protein
MDTNSRIFDDSSESNEIIFEYKKYLTDPILNVKTNFLLYIIEKGDNPFIYYLMNKVNDIIILPTIYLKNIEQANKFMKDTFEKSKYHYNGCINHNNENYLLYELNLFDKGMIPIYEKDTWWKVLPYEIINTQMVLKYKIDTLCFSFFKNHLNLLYLFNKTHKFEVPFVAYVGTGISLLNNHILFDANLKNGKFGNGYYFTSLDESYFHSLYDDLESTDNILKLLNNKYINELTPVEDRAIKIKNNQFFLNNTFIGEIPVNCKGTFTLHDYNEDFIYLKSSTSLKKCKNKINYYMKRKEDGCILKYVLFLKKSKLVIDTKGKKFDSYCSGKTKEKWFPTYMVKLNNFQCICYHKINKENSLSIEFLDKRERNMILNIK